MLEQTMVVDKARLIHKIGSFSDYIMSDTELKEFVSESDSEILRADNWVEVYRLINVLGGEKSGKSK